MLEFENFLKGIIIVCLMYMVLEVLEGWLYILLVDIFSFVIMVWEMWYGRRVFSESVYLDVMIDFSFIKVNICMLKIKYW